MFGRKLLPGLAIMALFALAGCDVDLRDCAIQPDNRTGPPSGVQAPFTLVSGGSDAASIVINSSDPKITGAANDMAAKLQAISGAIFSVVSGSGSRGIVVGVESDFTNIPFTINFSDGPDPNLTGPEFLREQYIIRSTSSGVWLIGKTPLAAQHAVWDLLHQFGYRQYFPRSTWEHVPSNDTLTIDIDKEETPDYRARRIWYNDTNLQAYPEWDNQTHCGIWSDRNRSNRWAEGFVLTSSHDYQLFVGTRNQSVFDAHPEYYALVDGVRTSYSGDVKLCIDNPGLVALSNSDAVSEIAAHPEWDSISREPSDGCGWCECDGVYDTLHNPDSTNCMGNFSSISDRVLYLANQAAQALVDAGYTNKYVCMYAYNQHSNVPVNTTVHSNVFISVTNGFLSGLYTYRELLEGWKNIGATLGVYDYFSWYFPDKSKPRIANAAYPRDLASDTRDYYNLNARFHSAESGDSWGPHGLSYYVTNRVMWDIDEADNVEAMIDEFLTNMFGPAYTPMKGFYDIINKDKELRSNVNLLANMYKFLDDAVTAAGSNHAVLVRIYELIKYTRYFDLRRTYEMDTNNQSNKEAMLTFAYRIRLNGLIQAISVWTRLGLVNEALFDPGYYLKDSTPVSESEVLTILSNGRTACGEPPDPYPSFAAENVVYSKDLVPAAVPMGLTHPAGDEVNPVNSKGKHNYWLWVDAGQTTITFDVDVQDYSGIRLCGTPKIRLYHPDNGDTPVDTVSYTLPNYAPYSARFTLTTSYTGLHKAILLDGSNKTVIDWSPSGVNDTVLATISSGVDVDVDSDEYHYLKRFYRGYWRQFFYVPAGTTTVGFWATEPVGQIYDGGNNIVATYLDNTGSLDGWYEVAVPSGQDGKVWSMIADRGIRLLSTVPPYFAKTVADLLLPREVVYGTSPGQAANPSPGNGVSSVNIDADLSWDVGQATATQELYFSTTNPPAHRASLSGTANGFDPGTLNSGETYYWRVDANNINGISTGVVWNFTTTGAP